MIDADDILKVVATHEAAHAVIWRNAGFEIVRARTWGTGDRTQGRVEINTKKSYRNVKEKDIQALDEGYLIGLLAGEQASIIAVDKYGLPMSKSYAASGCESDLHWWKKYRNLADLSRAATRQRARAQCYRHWNEIERLANRLIERHR